MKEKTMKNLSFPALGDVLAPISSNETLTLLANRRSTPALSLGLPGPSEEESEQLLHIGLRVPDHGKLCPWRVVRFPLETRSSFIEALSPLIEAQADPKKAIVCLAKFKTAPFMVMVVSHPKADARKPVWEQQLSSACVCQNLLIAAEALGYGANWITEWICYDPKARAILGLSDLEQVAGFVLIGTAKEAPTERERPDLNDHLSVWAL